jgi:putative YjhG/YagF family dehydratase
VDRLVAAAAETFRDYECIPFAGYCTDPCDGRSQGTSAMMDSLPFRNDGAIILRRLIRSLPGRRGILGVATCDKGLPAMMLALAGCRTLPGIIVPGGVTLPVKDAEDLGTVQSLGARFANNEITLKYAARMACSACGSAGGGCHFLGTAATSQVIAEALGIALPYSALAPSGEPCWLNLAKRSAEALIDLSRHQTPLGKILTPESIRNAMIVHAAFGGSTNLLLHLPAIAFAAGLDIPSVDDWIEVNQRTPRIVDVLPNGPKNYPTAMVYMAGAVPEVMLNLAQEGLLNTSTLTASGHTLGKVLKEWEKSETRRCAHEKLERETGIPYSDVIFPLDKARKTGLACTIIFPKGNLAPEGSVIKATAIDSSLINPQGKYLHRGKARVFTSEAEAIGAIKQLSSRKLSPGDVLVLIGSGPIGTGMEEIYQITSALKSVSWGKTVPVLTDARFSGVSTGPCIGHIGPEALAGGPIGRLRDGDQIEIEIDLHRQTGNINFIGDGDEFAEPGKAAEILEFRNLHPHLKPHPNLPDDTRLWAALQNASGGTWNGCVYDVDRICEILETRLNSGSVRDNG